MSFNENVIISAVEKVSQNVVNVSSVRFIQNHFLRVVPIKGVGSGLIISSEGFILTNNHVVEGTGKLEITLADGRSLESRIIGKDPTTDIAVLKTKTDDLSSVEFGDSDKLKVGQLAIAIGNPFGLLGGPTVTVGVISAIGRSIRPHAKIVLEDLIQTDAAINPGNSGGPLLDSDGKVVGINTAIIPFAHGIGFSIPINTAMRVAEELIEHGKVIRPQLGISGVNVDEKVASYYNLATKKGVLVLGMIKDGPAHRSGMVPGDVIVKINGAEIPNMEELQKQIRKRKVGDVIEVTTIRESRKMKIEVTLTKLPQ